MITVVGIKEVGMNNMYITCIPYTQHTQVIKS